MLPILSFLRCSPHGAHWSKSMHKPRTALACSLPVNVLGLITGVAAQRQHLTAVLLTRQIWNESLEPKPTSLKLMKLKLPLPPPHPSHTMLKPCHEWFLLPWAEMRVNTFYDLAVCQNMVIQICSSNGLDARLKWWSSWRKVSKVFGAAARTVSRLARPSRLLLLSPASLPLSLTHAQTRSEDRDTIQRDLWAQFVCFNGQEAPELTTDRPLWAVDSWEINVKSHQGFIKFWPRSGFLWPSEGLWFVGKHYEDNLQPGTLSIFFLLPLVWAKLPKSLASTTGPGQSFPKKINW